MFMNYHIDRQTFGRAYHHFIEWEHQHSKEILWITTLIIICLFFVMAFVWLNQSSRIQIYDPLQLDDLFYPYMLSAE